MANNNETTTKFKVDISELKKAMQEAKRQISVTNSEFKAISSSMGDWSKSTDGISAKLKQLDSNLKSQKTILSSLEAQYEAVVAEQGEGSAAADRLKISINNQRAVINNTEREISRYNATLEEVAEAEKKAAKTGKSVAEVLDDVGEKAEEAEDGFTVLKGAIATFTGNALTGLANGLKNAVSNLLSLADETREYRTELAKLETGAKQAGASTDYIKDKWQDMGAVLGDEGAVTEGLNNLLAAGFTTQEQMDAITGHLEGAAIKWKDTLKFEGLADGLQETLATGAAVGSFGEMLERSGVNLDTFNDGLAKCTSDADKQNYVLSQLSKLGLNDVSAAYRTQNKDLIAANKANSNYSDTLAQMGAKIEPVTTTLKEGFNGLLQEVLKLVQDVDMTAFTSKIEEGFGVLKDDVLPAVKEGFGWILENKDALIAGLAGIAAGFVAFKVVGLITSVVTAVKNLGSAITVLKVVITALGGPISIIITIISALVAAFIHLWNTSDSFREFWINLWDKIKNFCGKAVESISNFFTETVPAALDKLVENLKQLPVKMALWLANAILKVSQWSSNMITKAKTAASNFVTNVINFISQLPSKLWTWLVNTIAKVTEWQLQMLSKAKEAASNFIEKVVEFVKQLPSKVWSWLSDTISKVATFGSNLASKGKEAAQGLLDNIVNIAKSIPDKMKSIGSDVIGGLWNGISDAVSGLYDNIKKALSGLVDKAKEALGINSPSKVFADEVGKYIPQGIAVGIDKNAKSALNSIKDLGSNANSARVELGSSTTGAGVVNNFYQTNNSPKALSRLEIYRQSKNLLSYVGGA